MPRPKLHLIRFHGVPASTAKLRRIPLAPTGNGAQKRTAGHARHRRAVQPRLGRVWLGSAACHFGIEANDALEIAGQTGL